MKLGQTNLNYLS